MTTPTLLSPPVEIDSLVATAHALFASDKGLLAIDESIPTCNKRFARLGITQNEPARRAYRELIVTTPGLGECSSGAILYDETIREHTRDGAAWCQRSGPLDCPRNEVPAAVAGIAFLSGGQSGDLATVRLAAINNPALAPPWPIGFSFGLAIQQPALSIWDGHEENVASAQHALLQRATASRDARRRKHAPSPSTGQGAKPSDPRSSTRSTTHSGKVGTS